MAGLPWVRLDTGFPHNHKVLVLSARKQFHAVSLYIFGICYAGGQETAGFIPREALSILHGTTKTAAELVEIGLWKQDPGGWLIHGWDDKQVAGPEQQDRSTRARAAAMARWHPHVGPKDGD